MVQPAESNIMILIMPVFINGKWHLNERKMNETVKVGIPTVTF